jgi:hypothetical protein
VRAGGALCGIEAPYRCARPRSRCAGGFRALPLPGFYGDGTSPTVYACLPPAAERCQGWDVGMNAVYCGSGYLQSTPGCGTCGSGFFRSVAEACAACPDVDNAWSVVQLPLAFVGGVLGVALCVFGLLLVVRHYRGGTVASYGKRAAKFGVQMFVALQVSSAAVAAACRNVG